MAAVDEHEGWLGEWVDVVATAYSPHDPIDGGYHATKGDKWRWITADGRTDVRHTPYGIAVPLRAGTRKPYWAFGTKLLIPAETGYLAQTRSEDRVFSVDDVGNGRQYFRFEDGKLHVDLRFKSHKSAIEWAGHAGRRTIRVFKICGVAPEPAVVAEDFFATMELPVPPPSPVVRRDPPVQEEPASEFELWRVLLAFVGVLGTAEGTRYIVRARRRLLK